MKNNKNSEFSHTDIYGNIKMVDVSDKILQNRFAKAMGSIFFSKGTVELIKNNSLRKGNVLSLAKISGINSVKNASSLIILGHNISLNFIDVEFNILNDRIECFCSVKCFANTGVEMEALTGVSISLLNIYDMCKSVDKNMVICDIKLIEKIKE